MTTSRPPLSYDVFTVPEAPFTAPPPRVGDPPAWDPKTSTLIFGARDAVLVDALMTAVYHATGRRIRSLPITVEQLL